MFYQHRTPFQLCPVTGEMLFMPPEHWQEIVGVDPRLSLAVDLRTFFQVGGPA